MILTLISGLPADQCNILCHRGKEYISITDRVLFVVIHSKAGLVVMFSEGHDIGKYEFLRHAAYHLGALDARIIHVSDIIIEDRVTRKCHSGCMGYGNKLTCPPFVPKPEEFRRSISGYHTALLIKFTSHEDTGDEIIAVVHNEWIDPEAASDRQEESRDFRDLHFNKSTRTLFAMLELERIAVKAGYGKARAFVNSSCRLCEVCNVETGNCRYPDISRVPGHAVGINMKKTAVSNGIKLNPPSEGGIEPLTLLIID
jgi:predicted metal-binding protein